MLVSPTAVDAPRSLDRCFLGGLRCEQGVVLWPLARLRISPRAISVDPASALAAYLTPRLTLVRGELLRAERISRVGVFPMPGVRLVPIRGRPLIFWTLRPRRVLTVLESLGIAIAWSGHAAPYWGT
ncbi:MAG TPA: hypothetical protein VKX16_00710 [Chloroflexota bacterium]|nr:hypothetical protein [Chloroflexota bacterium]